jgi:hypothetical protein
MVSEIVAPICIAVVTLKEVDYKTDGYLRRCHSPISTPFF